MKSYLATIILVLFAASSAWSVTFDQATDIVISEVCLGNLEDTRLSTIEGIQEQGTIISSFSDEVMVPFNSYLFIVDRMPDANWEHPCQWVFVDVASGEFAVFDMLSPPGILLMTIIHEPLDLSSIGEYSYEKIIERIREEQIKIFGAESYDFDHSQLKGQRYALLIDGGYALSSNYIRYWDDIAFIYRALVNYYGYDEDNEITVCMSDGDNPANDRNRWPYSGYDSSPTDLDDDGDQDYSLDATRSTILSQLQWLVDNTTADDQVFIFTTDHGASDGSLCLWNQQSLYPNEFADYVEDMPAEVVICTFEQCYSGAFPDALADVEGCISCSAVDAYHSSYAMGPEYLFDTFVFHWTCAVNWAEPDFEGYDSDPIDADEDDSGEVEMDEAFDYADLHDTDDFGSQYQDPSEIGDVTTLWGNTTGINISITDWQLTETSGDGDGIIEPGESYDLTPYLYNGGSATATGVDLILSSDSSDLDIDTATTTCPDIPPDTTQHPSVPLAFTIHGDVDHNIHIDFNLNVNTDEGYDKDFAYQIGVVTDYGFRDFVESGEGYWEHEGDHDQWHISDTAYYSPTHCWRCGDTEGTGYDNNMDAHLYSPLIFVTDDPKETPYLSFWHQWGMYSSSDECYLLIDDGSGFVELDNFTGDSGSNWEEETYDLTAYTDTLVQLDFNMVTNASGNDELGWNVDNIIVTPNPYVGINVYNFITLCEDGKVIVTWQSLEDVGIIGFNLYRREASDTLNQKTNLTASPEGMNSPASIINDWQKLNQSLITGTNPYHFVDEDVILDVTYQYRLEAVYGDHSQNEAGSTITVQDQTQPFSYHLAQSYPNPTTGHLTIEYAIPESGAVSLKVYNLSGQLIDILVDEHQLPGIYSVKWNARDLASGVYIYTLSAGNFLSSKRLVLSK